MSIENYNSILFYIALALIISFFFSSIFKSDSKNRVLIFEYRKIKFCNIIYITLFLILLFFASYRTVKFSHGGSDAWYYVNYFLYGSKVEFSLKNILTFSGEEFLFYNFLQLMGKFVRNYHILFLIIYGVIIYSFLKIFRKNFNKNNAFLMSLLLILPYIKSFNIIRNALSVAIIYIAIEQLNKNKKTSFFILTIIAFLTHYTAIILLPFFIFNKFFKEKLFNKNMFILIYYVIIISISIFLVPILKTFLLTTGFRGYINSEFSFLGYSPSFLLAFMTCLFSKEIVIECKKNNSLIYYKLFIFFISLLPLFIIVGGGSRFNYVFEISRYVLWGVVYNVIYNKLKNSKDKIAFKFVSYLIVLAWIVFNILKIGDSYGILPYSIDI